MKNYYRIMLGAKSIYADECFKGNFVGADFGIELDLSSSLTGNWQEFNHKYIPIWIDNNPGKTKIAAGLSCGALWTVAKGLNVGDVVLCPNGSSSYYIGEVVSEYFYHKSGVLPHRRTVKWYPQTIERSAMSDALRNSTGSIGTVSQITKHAVEIELLIESNLPPVIISNDSTIEDPSEFAMEKHLEDFLVQNWKQTELGKQYDILELDGGIVGQQFQTDTGPIDILALSKDKKTFLVVELKKGRASDNVVGQIQRYMGYVKEELAEKDGVVRGVIIGLEDDKRIRRALAVTNNIEFYRYKVSFKLFKN